MQSSCDSSLHNELRKKKKSPLSESDLPMLSQKLWDVNWRDYFPKKLNHSVFACVGNYDEMNSFAKQHYVEIYECDPDDKRFLPVEPTASRVKYYREAVDVFLFKEEEKVVGMFTGNPLDWSSYYIRNCSILTEHQNKGLLQGFLSYFLTCLKDIGVCRVETDISPSNLANINVLNKARFNITGVNLSERWGSVLRFSKFLKKENESVFLDQFCFGVRYQEKLNHNPKPRREL